MPYVPQVNLNNDGAASDAELQEAATAFNMLARQAFQQAGLKPKDVPEIKKPLRKGDWDNAVFEMGVHEGLIGSGLEKPPFPKSGVALTELKKGAGEVSAALRERNLEKPSENYLNTLNSHLRKAAQALE